MSLGEPTIQASFATYLRSLPEVAALCGDRVTPQLRTSGEPLPALTYFTLSHLSVDNLADGPCGMNEVRLQVDVWAATYAVAKRLEWAIRGTHDTPRLAAMKSARMGDHWVAAANVEDSRDLDEPPEHAEERGIHRVSLEVAIWYNETPLGG